MFSIISYDKVHCMAHMILVRSDKPMDWSKGKVCDNPKKDVHKMEAWKTNLLRTIQFSSWRGLGLHRLNYWHRIWKDSGSYRWISLALRLFQGGHILWIGNGLWFAWIDSLKSIGRNLRFFPTWHSVRRRWSVYEKSTISEGLKFLFFINSRDFPV